MLDTCRAYDLALDAVLDPGTTIHLGTGTGVSVDDLVSLVGEILGRSLEVERVASRTRPEASEVEALVSDPSFARASLGWEPQHSLRQGLENTIDWFRETGRVGGDRYHV